MCPTFIIRLKLFTHRSPSPTKNLRAETETNAVVQSTVDLSSG